MKRYIRRARILLLIVEFYIIAALVIASCVSFVTGTLALTGLGPWIPWFTEFRYALILVVAPIAVRAILPNRYVLRPNGIVVNEGEAPDLFAMCRDSAHRAKFDKEFDVYADLSPSPSSLRYLGFAGIRSRYAVVLGIPGLEAMSVAQLRIALVYVFAMLRLEMLPEIWLKDTRNVLTALLKSLGARRRYQTWIAVFFQHYISRCDRLLAAHAAEAEAEVADSMGLGVFRSTREFLASVAKSFDEYWWKDVNPILQRGHIPPITEGFHRVRTRTATNGVPVRSALELIRSPWHIERRIIAALGATNQVVLQEVPWELIPARVLLPSWKNEVAPYLEKLAAVKVVDIGSLIPNELRPLGHRLFAAPGSLPSAEELKWRAARILAVATALTLHRTGWDITYEGAGDPMAFERNGHVIDPFEKVDKLLQGTMSKEEWTRLCVASELLDTTLVPGKH